MTIKLVNLLTIVNEGSIQGIKINSEDSDDTNGGQLISGSSGDDILVSLGGNDTLEGKEGNDILAGVSGNDKLLGGSGKDTLTGGGIGISDDNDIFVTADTSGIDTLTGGEDSDLFVLGGKSYPDLNNNSVSIVHYDEAGKNDFALVTDFNPNEDVIMLGASRNNYSLVNVPTGMELYFGEDLVAVIANNRDLSLNESYFVFPYSNGT